MDDKLKKQYEAIMNNAAYTPEQKNLMLGNLFEQAAAPQTPAQPTGGYQRQSEVIPEPTLSQSDVDLIATVEKNIEDASSNEDWKDKFYDIPYKPTFTAVEIERKRYPIGNGKEVTLRKLKAGDYALLATLVPRWKYHLLGDAPVNPILDSVQPYKLIFLLIERAVMDWEFDGKGMGHPSDFALSVLKVLRFFTKEGLENPDSIELNAFLDCELDQLHDLASGMYRANVNFFKKIYSRLGPITNLISTITGIYSSAIEGLQKSADNLSDDNSNESDNLKNSSKESEKSLTSRKRKRNVGA